MPNFSSGSVVFGSDLSSPQTLSDYNTACASCGTSTEQAQAVPPYGVLLCSRCRASISHVDSIDRCEVIVMTGPDGPYVVLVIVKKDGVGQTISFVTSLDAEETGRALIAAAETVRKL